HGPRTHRWPSRLIAILSRSHHFEQVGRVAVEVPAQSGDGPQLSRVYLAVWTHYGVGDMDHQHLANDQVSGDGPGADRHDLQDLALQVHRRFRQSRRLHLDRRYGPKTDILGFVLPIREFLGRQVDLLGQRRDGRVYHELAGGLDIQECVLLGPVAAPGRGKDDDRRVRPERVEKAEWGQIDPAGRVHGRHPRNRPRGDHADEYVIHVHDRGVGDVDLHVNSGVWRRSRCGRSPLLNQRFGPDRERNCGYRRTQAEDPEQGPLPE